jgi:hypothetical protein
LNYSTRQIYNLIKSLWIMFNISQNFIVFWQKVWYNI